MSQVLLSSIVDAAEFIPQERKILVCTGGSQRRLDSNRIGRRNCAHSPPVTFPGSRSLVMTSLLFISTVFILWEANLRVSRLLSSPLLLTNLSRTMAFRTNLQKLEEWKAAYQSQESTGPSLTRLLQMQASWPRKRGQVREWVKPQRAQSFSESEKEIVGCRSKGSKTQESNPIYIQLWRGPKSRGKLKSEWVHRMTPNLRRQDLKTPNQQVSTWLLGCFL